jgi:hypothetical protein
LPGFERPGILVFTMQKFNHPLRWSLIVASAILLLNAWAMTNGVGEAVYTPP